MRRAVLLFGAVVGLCASGWLVAPASAAPPQGGITSPTDNATLNQAAVQVVAHFEQPPTAGRNGRIDHVDITIVAKAGQELPDGASHTESGGGPKVDVDWVSPPLPANGPYEVHATATGTDALGGSASTDAAPRRFSLNVPPAIPTGLKTASDNAAQTVTINWTANSEPDLAGYQVQRQGDNDNTYQEAGQTTAPTFTDTVTPGHWKYRVVAVRSGATSTELLASDPSTVSSATVTAPPATSVPNGSGSGSSGDGSGTSGTGSGSSGSAGGTAATGSGGSSAAAGSQAVAKAGKVDFSDFAALLDSARNRPPVHFEAPDPGFQETLPFQPGQAAAQGGDDLGSAREVGPNEGGTASRLVVDRQGQRRHSLAYVAGGMLIFVVAMHFVWIKAEVDREPLELAPVDPGADGPPPGPFVAAAPAPDPVPYRARRAARRLPVA